MIRTLTHGDVIPQGQPRRYQNAAGYVRLRWLVAVDEYVEVYEHRLVAGMPDADLHVHHLNRDRADNRRDNLLVLSAAEHGLLHAREDRGEYDRRLAERGGYRSREAQTKADRAASRRAAIHDRALRMREMYDAGSSTTEVGASFGIHNSRVSVHLRRVGTSMRPFDRWAS